MASPFSKFVLGATIGGAVGAILALLLAPRKGSETRQFVADEVSKRYESTKSTAETTWKDSVDKAKETYSSSTDELKTKADELKSKATTLKSDIEDKAKVVSTQVKDQVKAKSEKASEAATVLEEKGRSVLSQFAPKASTKSE